MPRHSLKKEAEAECGICITKLKVGVRPYCGHYFHASCMLGILEQHKRRCPVCKAPFDRCEDTRAHDKNVLGNIVRGMINPLLVRRSEISERDVNDVARIFPSVSRYDIEAEILSAGSVEQAIVNISEWI